MLFVFALAVVACCASVSASANYRPTLSGRANDPSLICCTLINAALPGKVAYVGDLSYTNQQIGLGGYWSAQEGALTPTCRVTPTSAQDVSVSVAALAKHKCLFAIRGGGHMSWAGAANIDGGVTIDMSSLASVDVSNDRTTTAIGGGARWSQVYSKLDSMGLAVSGGRVADVGVGGLLTGGGNSFFAPRYGLPCDGVKNFEVVLGSGDIVNANASSHPDLFKALKGGNNNFGVVTRFDLTTFAQGLLWGGFIYNLADTIDEQWQYLQDFTTASGNGEDDYATIIHITQFSNGAPIAVINTLTYTKPEPYPAIFKNFTDIQPQLVNDLRITNLTGLTLEIAIDAAEDLRELTATATFANNATLFAKLYAIAHDVYEPLLLVAGFEASFVLQPIPRTITSRSAATGGNSLGLDGKEDLVWLDLQISWLLEIDDAAVTSATQTLLRNGIAYAKSQGLYNEFVYLNYAMQTQDPIASYGAGNVANLKTVSNIYDPAQVFQKLVPGGFKLSRTGSTCC